MDKFNTIRYIIALLAPAIVLPLFGITWTIVALVALLFLNNLTDDLVFYFGGLFMRIPKKGHGVLSPVNGVVTKVEYQVPLFSHLSKVDALTDETLQVFKAPYTKRNSEYTHISIFLNKFNSHVVTSAGASVLRVCPYNSQSEPVEMVEDGYLLPLEDGKYLNNSFVLFEYSNGVIAVFTLDKYVSKYQLAEPTSALIDMIICRGSQCDLYIPKHYNVFVFENSVLKNFQSISNDAFITTHIDKRQVRKSIRKEIKRLNITARQMVTAVAVKTIDTCIVNSPLQSLLLLLIAIALPEYVPAYICLLLACFYYERTGKHFLYTLANLHGYTEKQKKAYKTLKAIKTWQNKGKKK